MKAASYHYADSAEGLLAWLHQAAVEDKRAESMVKLFGGLTVASILLSCGSIFVFPWALVLFVPALIACAAIANKHRAQDLDDRKRETALRLLKVLKADIPARESVEIQIDFRDYTSGGRLASGQKKDGQYEHRWLELSTTLADGSAVRFAAADYVKRRERSKRKYTKVVERSRSAFAVSLRLDKRYGPPAAAASRLRSAAPPVPLALRQVADRGRSLRAVFDTPSVRTVKGRGGAATSSGQAAVPGDALLQGLRWMYAGLTGRGTS